MPGLKNTFADLKAETHARVIGIRGKTLLSEIPVGCQHRFHQAMGMFLAAAM